RAPAVRRRPPPRPESNSSRRGTLSGIAAQAPDARGPQAAVGLARTECEARVGCRAAAELICQQLRERRAVLEAVAGAAAHDPHALVLGVWRGDEVGVGGQAVVAAGARREGL